MEFKTINNYKPGIFREGGFKKTVDVYEDIINPKTGKLETKKTKEENFYAKIQENKESQELENIIKRYNIDLNEQHITDLSQEIVDMTVMPEDLIETYAMTKKLENMFNETTADIKNHFKDFAGFLKSFQNGTLKSEIQKLSMKKLPVQQVDQKQTQVQVQQPNQAQVQQPNQAQVQQNVQQQNQNGGIIYG